MESIIGLTVSEIIEKHEVSSKAWKEKSFVERQISNSEFIVASITKAIEILEASDSAYMPISILKSKQAEHALYLTELRNGKYDSMNGGMS